MTDLYSALAGAGIVFKKDFTVGPLTTFRIGGKVECFAEAHDMDQLCFAVKQCAKYKKEIMAVGSMSNMVVADGRIKKVFISLKGRFEQLITRKGCVVYCGAGVKIPALMSFLAKNNLAGAEFLTGIPGSLGGAVYMNAGAFGKTVCGLLVNIYAVDRRGRQVALKAEPKMFGYRKSVFQKNGMIITGADLKLARGDGAKIRERMKEIITERHGKHPWKEPSAGSFFKNRYPEYVAGKLIEEAGLKGASVGGAAVSVKHANFIVNKGGAKAADVKKLAQLVKKEVYKKFKVKLEEEVRYIK